jgi:hypothetical protein
MDNAHQRELEWQLTLLQKRETRLLRELDKTRRDMHMIENDLSEIYKKPFLIAWNRLTSLSDSDFVLFWYCKAVGDQHREIRRCCSRDECWYAKHHDSCLKQLKFMFNFLGITFCDRCVTTKGRHAFSPNELVLVNPHNMDPQFIKDKFLLQRNYRMSSYFF